MDTQETKTYTRMETRWDKCRPTHSPYGKVLGGVVLVGVGVVLLAREMGVYFPDWMFTWPMLLIVIGFYVGAKHLFRNMAWITLVIVGAVFLIDDIVPGIDLSDYFWPIMLIAFGLMMIFKPRRQNHWSRWENAEETTSYTQATPGTSEDRIDTVSVFGGVKKNILSKDFKGGEVTCIFGGAEINLSQADINGRVELEMTQIFGGTKLIVPPHWEVQPDMVAILGGVDDKRPVQVEGGTNSGKILVLRGTAVLGGLEIRSY